jgi:hypothetical protein
MHMSIIKRPLRALCVLLALTVMAESHAAVQFPAMEIMTLSGDTGARAAGSAVGSALTMDASALFTLSSAGVILSDFPDTPFTVSATRIDARTFGPGTLTVGSLLSASFASLTIRSLPVGASFSADLVFTGGSLAPDSGIGRLEGSLFRTPATAPINASGAFVASDLVAKIGPVSPPVVPLPGAVWLFASGCAVLLARSRSARRGAVTGRAGLESGAVAHA